MISFKARIYPRLCAKHYKVLSYGDQFKQAAYFILITIISLSTYYHRHTMIVEVSTIGHTFEKKNTYDTKKWLVI